MTKKQRNFKSVLQKSLGVLLIKKNQIVDFEVTRSKDLKAYQILAKRLSPKYVIKIVCNDYYFVCENQDRDECHAPLQHCLARVHRRGGGAQGKTCAFNEAVIEKRLRERTVS